MHLCLLCSVYRYELLPPTSLTFGVTHQSWMLNLFYSLSRVSIWPVYLISKFIYGYKELYLPPKLKPFENVSFAINIACNYITSIKHKYKGLPS